MVWQADGLTSRYFWAGNDGGCTGLQGFLASILHQVRRCRSGFPLLQVSRLADASRVLLTLQEKSTAMVLGSTTAVNDSAGIAKIGGLVASLKDGSKVAEVTE